MNIREELADHILSDVLQHLGDSPATRTMLVEVLQSYEIVPAAKRHGGNIGSYVAKFLEAKKLEGLSGKTLANYRQYLTEFATAANRNINRISTDDVRAYVAAKNVKDTSRQTILCTLRSFFSWLTREEIIRKNPMLKIPSIKVAKKKLRKPFTPDEQEQFKQAATSIREKALVELFLSTGCRVSEIVNANILAVNFERRSMRVVGKGNKERTVYFSYKARMYLKQYLASRRDDSPALFINTRGGKRISVRSVQKLFAAIGEKARLTTQTNPHRARHTMAFTYLNKGGKMPTLQQLLGHESPSTTQIYAEISDQNIRYEYDMIAA